MSDHSKHRGNLVGPPCNRPDNSHSLGTSPSESNLETLQLDEPQVSKQASQHGRTHGIIRKIWLTAFLPAVASAYLAFCYVTATSLVPVRIWMIDRPIERIFEIKAGVTTINIIVVAISLLPLKTLLDDIQSEEFFRTLHKFDSGAPLKNINRVSIPSNTLIASIQAMLGNRTSKYYPAAVLSAIIAALISSIAPAALSVGMVSVDGDVMAIEVGAIGIDSAYGFETNLLAITVKKKFKDRTGEAAAMGWMQNVLGVKTAFSPTSPKYGVPVPLNVDTADRVRYLTDVVIMDPICSWTVPTLPPPTFANSSHPFPTLGLELNPYFGIVIEKTKESIESEWQKIKALNVAGDHLFLEISNIRNSTTLDPATDGTMAWIISQCTSCPRPEYALDQSVLDLSELPTEVFNFSINATNTTIPFTTRYSILVCKPQISIETREVALDGTGKIQVLESTKWTPQGNLHPVQTNLLLGNGLMKYTSDSGPEADFDDIGRAAQVKMFFGSNVGNSTTTPVLKPQSIEKITEEFMLAQQAALRTYLSGVLGTAFVPGRGQVTMLVFTSSLPHIIISTILFSLVSLFINLCYRRSATEQFTLFSIAAATARSNVGAVCEDAKYAGRAHEGEVFEEAAIELVKDRRVYLTGTGGPGPSLHME